MKPDYELHEQLKEVKASWEKRDYSNGHFAAHLFQRHKEKVIKKLDKLFELYDNQKGFNSASRKEVTRLVRLHRQRSSR